MKCYEALNIKMYYAMQNVGYGLIQSLMFIFLMCRTLIEKSAMGRLVLLVTVSEEDIQIHHSIQSRQNFSISMKTAGHISIGHWTHMTLQVGSVFLFSYPFCGYLYRKIGQNLILFIMICLDCF